MPSTSSWPRDSWSGTRTPYISVNLFLNQAFCSMLFVPSRNMTRMRFLEEDRVYHFPSCPWSRKGFAYSPTSMARAGEAHRTTPAATTAVANAEARKFIVRISPWMRIGKKRKRRRCRRTSATRCRGSRCVVIRADGEPGEEGRTWRSHSGEAQSHLPGRIAHPANESRQKGWPMVVANTSFVVREAGNVLWGPSGGHFQSQLVGRTRDPRAN